MANIDVQLQTLITKLQHLDNETLLQRVSDFVDGILAASNEVKTDWWEELPSTVQQDYEESIQQMEAGEESDVSDFLKTYRQ